VARLVALAAALAISPAPALAQDPPSNRELYELYQRQQEQIDATADAVDDANGRGTGHWFAKTRLGGYGEVHFNFLDGANGAKNKSEADFHRFVLFINHEYSDKIRLFSEIELEHAFAGGGGPGEVELEQAFIEFDLPLEITATGGLFLMPVGILNETHEPPTFYGVERNPIEKNIIPTSWWEGGGMLSRKFDHGISANLVVSTGLQTEFGLQTDSDNFNIRKGRQKLAKADASDVAITGRVVYRGLPGLELGVSAQWSENIAAMGPKTTATLFETHVIYERGPFGMRALYARWDLHSTAAKAGGKDVQYGFYFEPSFRICEWLGVFGRYNQFNTSAGSAGGTQRQYDIGFNFWPHENVVLKIDGQFQHNKGGDELDGVNLGLGFSF
jgi:hypothetical protein